MLRAGFSKAEIVNRMKYPKSTVYSVAADFEAAENAAPGSSTSARKTHEREKPFRNDQTLESVQQVVLENPAMSIASLAHEFDRRTMGRIVHEDLRYQSYVIKIRQMLSAKNKLDRVIRCKQLLNELKNDAAGRLRFFSDEKIFTVDEKINRQNDRWLAVCPEDVPIAQRTKFAANCHVLGVVSNEGDVMPPHFFEKRK